MPLSYDLEYDNVKGTWLLSSVGQHQMAVWDVAPITGKVKVSDGKTTKEYDLTDGTFKHADIVYDDATGTCRTSITLTDYDAYIAKYSEEMGRAYRRVAGSTDVTYELVYDMNARPRKRAWAMAKTTAAKPAPRHMAALAVTVAADAAVPAGSNDTINVEPVPQVTVDYGYDADGDGNNDTKVVTVDENGKAAIDTPARDGFTFKGWKTADGQDFDPSSEVAADVTIVAQWDKNPEPVKPSQPDKPAEPTKPAKPAAQKPARADAKPAASATAQATAALPATGDTANNGLIAVLFASGAAMLVAAKKRLGLKD